MLIPSCEKLVEDHYKYIESVIELTYKTAMAHGYGHGYEDGWIRGYEDATFNRFRPTTAHQVRSVVKGDGLPSSGVIME